MLQHRWAEAWRRWHHAQAQRKRTTSIPLNFTRQYLRMHIGNATTVGAC